MLTLPCRYLVVTLSLPCRYVVQELLATQPLASLLVVLSPILRVAVLVGALTINLLALSSISPDPTGGDAPSLEGFGIFLPLLALVQLGLTVALLAAHALLHTPPALEARWCSRRLAAHAALLSGQKPLPSLQLYLAQRTGSVEPLLPGYLGALARTSAARGALRWGLSLRELYVRLRDGNVRAQDGFLDSSARSLLDWVFIVTEPSLLLHAGLVLTCLPSLWVQLTLRAVTPFSLAALAAQLFLLAVDW